MRTIGLITTSRADWGMYAPIARLISADRGLRLRLYVSGTHLSEFHGATAVEIEREGFEITERIPILSEPAADSPQAIAMMMANMTREFSASLARTKPDILVLVGDRFEMHAAAVATLPFNLPLAHVHGGELTLGAVDEGMRHSLTKLSHLHFVSTDEYAQRVIQMGEEPWRVTVSGAPALDNIRQVKLRSTEELKAQYSDIVEHEFLLVTFHPVTREFEDAEWQISELNAALETIGLPVIFTAPNCDTNQGQIRERIESFIAGRPDRILVENFGIRNYFSILRRARAMVGNSSSGIVEAASFELPVVNVGSRQQGRARSKNVIDVGNQRDEIAQGIRRALELGFRARLAGVPNIHGDGHAGERIVEKLSSVSLDDRLLKKHFYDLDRPVRLAAKRDT